MGFDLSGKPISTARITVPRYGLPRASVVLVDPADLAIGSRVTLTAGDFAMVATITDGGTVASSSRYELVGGAGGWDATVEPRPYGDAAGVSLATAAGDLATECGETLGTVDDRALDAHWTRLGGTASTALRELVGERWYVDAAGVTHCAARPVATAPSASEAITVSDYDPATGRAELAAEDDGLVRFLPGAMIASPLLPAPITIVDTVLHVSASSVRAEVLSTVSSPLVELVLRVFSALTRWTKFHGLYTYEVLLDSTDPSGAHEHEIGTDDTNVPAGEVDLRNVSGLSELPDAIRVPKAHGLPGAWSSLAPGTVALVGFQNGSPARPYVALYLPNQPIPSYVGVNASNTICLGNATTAVSLAKRGEVNFALQMLHTQITQLGGTGPLPSITGTHKLKGE